MSRVSAPERLLARVYSNVILTRCNRCMICIPLKRNDQIFPSSAFTLKACLLSVVLCPLEFEHFKQY